MNSEDAEIKAALTNILIWRGDARPCGQLALRALRLGRRQNRLDLFGRALGLLQKDGEVVAHEFRFGARRLIILVSAQIARFEDRLERSGIEVAELISERAF